MHGTYIEMIAWTILIEFQTTEAILGMSGRVPCCFCRQDDEEWMRFVIGGENSNSEVGIVDGFRRNLLFRIS